MTETFDTGNLARAFFTDAAPPEPAVRIECPTCARPARVVAGKGALRVGMHRGTEATRDSGGYWCTGSAHSLALLPA